MEPELAQEAVESMQAAPVAGAGSEKEREKSELLERMAENEEIGEVLVVEDEPVAEDEEPEITPVAHAAAEAVERKQAHESVAREFPEALTEGTELFEACQEEMAYTKSR